MPGSKTVLATGEVYYLLSPPLRLSKFLILDFFKDKKDYQRFVFDQADDQRELEKIKSLTGED